MPRYDFNAQRLFTDTDLYSGAVVELDRGQANYLLNVLRMKDGDLLLLFNGRDGEWRGRLEQAGRKKAQLKVAELMRAQTAPYDLHYLFAPLKQARLEYMVQKAVEMGAGVLQPVRTQYTQVRKLNTDRMNAQAKEAAEQCGILTLPDIREPVVLDEAVADLQDNRHLIFCDENDDTQNPLLTLKNVPEGPIAVLIGPEGGFAEQERKGLLDLPNVTPISLGPRILRADTAAVAALALVQAMLGDWDR